MRLSYYGEESAVALAEPAISSRCTRDEILVISNLRARTYTIMKTTNQ